MDEHWNPVKGFDGVVARIVTSNDGGPIRRIVNGRSHRPTGTFVSLKAGGRAMPHESVGGELRAMCIAEVATPVRRFLAQPHRLEIMVSGRSRPLISFPDFAVEVEASAVRNMNKGRDFANALMTTAQSGGHFRTVILEIKTDADHRMNDPDYRLKLQLATLIYNGLGAEFMVVNAEPGLVVPNFSAVKLIALHKFTAVNSRDVEIAASLVEKEPILLTDLAKALGDGPHGFAKAYALHVKRVISIALHAPLGTRTVVRPVRDRRAGPLKGPLWPEDHFSIH